MFRIPESESNHWFTSSHEVVQAIVMASQLVNSVGRGPAYQDSGKSHIARQQLVI